MQRIGFIGASGMMGHGMAKNLQAKGHPLALTVHRNAERVADLLAAGATQAASPQALAAGSDLVFLWVTGLPWSAGRGRVLQRGTSLAPVSCSCASTSEGTNLCPWPSAQASTSDWCTASPTIEGAPRPSARWV